MKKVNSEKSNQTEKVPQYHHRESEQQGQLTCPVSPNPYYSNKHKQKLRKTSPKLK